MANRTLLSRNPLSFALASALVVSAVAPAFAQEAGNEVGGKNAVNLDRVSVVGSRIKRAEVEGPAPVTVITRADIDREGFQSVGDMLQTLTQNTTSSFTGDLNAGGFTPNAQVVNLRNLGPGYTLTLINGRRPAQYPQPYNRDNNVVNIKAIPSSIVERVEILTGGASAIYGSDAVAGVVNIVLRKNYDGQQIKLTTGTTEEGGGDSVNVEYTGGKTGDRWSATYALQYQANEPVFASQRDFLADTRQNEIGLAVNPSLSLAALSVAGRNGHTRNFNSLYDAQACDAFGYTTVTTATRGTYCGSYTQPASRSIQNKNQNFNGYAYGTFDFTDTLQGFGSVNFYKTEAKSSSGTEFWATSSDRFTSNRSGATTGAYYDSNLRDIIQLQRVFNPFELGGNEAASTNYDEKSFDVTVGITGTIADRFDWEASANYGKYEYTADRPRLLAKPVHDYFLGPLQGYTTDNYPIYALDQSRWNSPITPEIYRSFATRVKNEAESTSATANFNISGDLLELPAGAVGFAGVIEAVRQTTDLTSDPRTNQLRPLDGQTIFNLTSSGETHGSRDRYALGTEFRIPIFSNLSMNIAGRYDKYDDITAVDDAKTWNAGLEWRPFSNLLVRASYATSFRAPDMQLVYAEGAASYSNIVDDYSCRSGTGLGQPAGTPGRTRAQCNRTTDITYYQAQSLTAGNPKLKEEEGKSWGAGFVWDIVDGMSMSVDYYKIRLEDAASQLSSTYLLQNEANCRLGVRPDGSPFPFGMDSTFCQNLTSLITRTSAPGTTLDGRIQRLNTAYINTALVETSGIDATYKYRLDTDRLGRFGLDLGYSLMLTNKYQENDDDELIDYRDLPDFDWSQRSRFRGSLSWSKNEWGATLFSTRYGSNWNRAQTQRLGPYSLYNLQLTKKFGPNVTADFTVVNLTNNTFRRDPTDTAYPYFNPLIGADPLGRRYYISLSYRF
ncbi:MAG: TonB-dependent receptor domain-containing protein [Stenotrophomonas sp.]